MKIKQWFGLIMMFGMLILGGCTNTQRSLAVAATEAVFAIDSILANDYIDGNLGIKPDASIVKQIISYQKIAKDRLDTLRTAAQNGDVTNTAEILAANDAINGLTSYLVSKGVLKGSVTLLPTSN